MSNDCAAKRRKRRQVQNEPARFLADHDLNVHIVTGVQRREPALDFVRVRDIGMSEQSDEEILDHAKRQGLLVVSHDANTMPAAAYARLDAGDSFPGLFMVRQTTPIATVIDHLVLIWAASELEEWQNQVVFLPFD